MSDEGGGFNPCECVWGHEMAMRRLLNVLRNSQASCTDAECFTDDTGSPQANPDGMLLMSLVFVVALFLYYFRPTRQIDGPSKPSGNEHNFHGAPPSPPPATN